MAMADCEYLGCSFKGKDYFSVISGNARTVSVALVLGIISEMASV
jgi:hypothetical protein